jgi:hypothetical protein
MMPNRTGMVQQMFFLARMHGSKPDSIRTSIITPCPADALLLMVAPWYRRRYAVPPP